MNAMKRRESIAICIALLGTGLGAAWVGRYGLNHSIAFYVAGVWAVMAFWVNPSPHLHSSMGEIYQAARRRELPRQTPIARTLRLGMIALMVLGAVIWIRTGH
jgi:hypothetical protein